jgi:hypothetical protein
VQDSIIPLFNSHFVPQTALPLVYAAACGTLLTRARLSTPSLQVITTPFIRDVNPALNFGNPMSFADYSQDPLQLHALEELVHYQTDSAVTSESNAGIAGLMIQNQPQPAGNVYTLRGTAAGTLVVGGWTNVGAITWFNTLPQGVYAIVGAGFFSAGAIAGRFLIPGIPWRPGGPGIVTVTNRIAPLFRNGNLGVWGTFNNYALPGVEMLSGTADTVEEIYMDIMKIQ